jgi:hypothetical protein
MYDGLELGTVPSLHDSPGSGGAPNFPIGWNRMVRVSVGNNRSVYTAFRVEMEVARTKIQPFGCFFNSKPFLHKALI